MASVRSSVRIRLTLWYSGALAVVLLAFALGTFLFTRDRLRAQVTSQLHADVASVQEVLEHETDELGELEEHGVVPLFCVEQGPRVVYETGGWRRLKFGVSTQGGPTTEQSVRGDDGREYPMLAARFVSGSDEFRIIVARDEESTRRAIASLAWVLGTSYPIALLLAAAGGYLLAGRMLAPVGAMARKAREITADRLAERLPVKNPDDEFGQLATAFNDVLVRLENSFERLKRFTADASHELRTPLTAIRSVGEVALRDNREAAAYRDVIGSMLEEADRLTHLVECLLTLTRADSGKTKLKREAMDLSVMAREVVDYLHVLAEERSQTITLQADDAIMVEVDPIMLRQAIVNVIDNAIKYTRPGGRITVSVIHSSAHDALIEVADTGSGIPPNEQERIFERFYRIDKARSREEGGVGLGLAIARWSVEANDGRIEVDSVLGEGSTFRVTLPSLS